MATASAAGSNNQQAVTKPVAPAATQAAPAATKAADSPAKPKVERIAEMVKMTDGRSVEFVGKRKLLKETIITGDKVAVRLDFRNGETRTMTCPASLVLKAAGHGLEQKLGDETAGTEKVEDMVLEVEELIKQLLAGDWTTARESGGFSGARVVLRAICEVTGKTDDEVKAFLQGKLDKAKAAGQALSRKALYDSFRSPTSKTGPVIQRLEREAAAGKASINADDALKELGL